MIYIIIFVVAGLFTFPSFIKHFVLAPFVGTVFGAITWLMICVFYRDALNLQAFCCFLILGVIFAEVGAAMSD